MHALRGILSHGLPEAQGSIDDPVTMSRYKGEPRRRCSIVIRSSFEKLALSPREQGVDVSHEVQSRGIVGVTAKESDLGVLP